MKECVALRNRKAKNIALCGVLASAAIVIMCLGGLIPFATYVCPVLCTLISGAVLLICGKRLSCIWYFVVCLLGLMLGPDKEASVIFVFLGAYPCLKIYFDRSRIRAIWKLLYFNCTAVTASLLSAYVMGLTEMIDEFDGLGAVGFIVIAILANVTFILLDILLTRISRLYRNKRR